MPPRPESADSTRENIEKPKFSVEYMTEGLQAHGFGRTADARTYSFRVSKSTLSITVYHEHASSDVPDSSEVVAHGTVCVLDVDLADERSVIGAVRDALNEVDSTR